MVENKDQRPTMQERYDFLQNFTENYYLKGNEVATFLERPDLVLTNEEREVAAHLTILVNLEANLMVECIEGALQPDNKEFKQALNSVVKLRERLENTDDYVNARNKEQKMKEVLRNG